jgi:hypothetical protein
MGRVTGSKITFECDGSNLRNVPSNARICQNFRQIYDNFMMMRFMNNVSTLLVPIHHVKNKSDSNSGNDFTIT